MRELHRLLARAQTLDAMGLPEQLQWLEDLAAAAAHPNLGPGGLAASRDLRAALGAIVVFAETPAAERDVAKLGAVTRGFIMSALRTLAATLADLHTRLARDADDSQREPLHRSLATLQAVLNGDRG